MCVTEQGKATSLRHLPPPSTRFQPLLISFFIDVSLISTCRISHGSKYVERGNEPRLVIDNVTYEYQGEYECRATSYINGQERVAISDPVSLQVVGKCSSIHTALFCTHMLLSDSRKAAMPQNTTNRHNCRQPQKKCGTNYVYESCWKLSYDLPSNCWLSWWPPITVSTTTKGTQQKVTISWPRRRFNTLLKLRKLTNSQPDMHHLYLRLFSLNIEDSIYDQSFRDSAGSVIIFRYIFIPIKIYIRIKKFDL